MKINLKLSDLITGIGKKTKLSHFIIMILVLAFPLLPFSDQYLIHVGVLLLLYSVLALGLNIVVGYAGLLDLGFIAFYGIGAYSYAILNKTVGLPFILGLPLGMVLAVLFSIIIGIPTLRVRGDYLALVTLGFGEMFRIAVLNETPLTGGPQGLMNIQSPMFGLFKSPEEFFYLALLLFFVFLLVSKRLRNSMLGRAWVAASNDELAAETCGIPTFKIYLRAFTVGAAIAGAAGVFFAGWQNYVSPESFVLLESVAILSMVILGGMGSIKGTVIAAVLLTALPEVLRIVKDFRMLVFGAALIVTVILRHRLAVRKRQVRDFGQRNVFLPGGSSTSSVAANSPAKEISLPQDQTILLNIKNMSKRFGGVRAVENVSLSIRQGEIVGIVGHNGSGKTTLFNCICGIEHPDSGSITFMGTDIAKSLNNNMKKNSTKKFVHQVAKLGLARSFQNNRLFNAITVKENVLIGLSSRDKLSIFDSLFIPPGYKSLLKRFDMDTEKVIELLGLSKYKEVPAETLSFGMRRTVELARALVARPNMVLLDEITAGLSKPAKVIISELIHVQRIKNKITFMIIDHDVDFLSTICDRIYFLHLGKILIAGPPSFVFNSNKVKKSYLGIEN